MNRKSQVSMFILLGVIMIFLILFMIYIANKIEPPKGANQYVYPDIGEFVEEGHINALECTSYLVGRGYLDLQGNGLASIDVSQGFGSSFMTHAIPYIINFSSKEQEGYSITQGEIKADVLLNMQNIEADTMHIIEVQKIGDKKTVMDKFHVSNDVRFGVLHESAQKQYDTEDISLNALADAKFNKNIYIIKNTSIFVFTDPLSKIDQIPYKYAFWKK